jgi:hypothetical protein
MEKYMINQLRTYMVTFLALCIALSATCVAQKKPVEKNKGKKGNTEAAWKLQAQSVSEEVGLSKDQTAKITDAYLTAQKSHKQALKDLPEEKDKDKSRAATQAVIEKDRAKFVSSLKGALTEDLVARVIPTLGSFNAKWDGFVVALQDCKLEKATLKSAMKLVIKYVNDSEAANSEMMKTSNRKANSKPFKATLDTGLASLLSADQLKMWKEATASSVGKNKTKSTATDKSEKADKTGKSKKK